MKIHFIFNPSETIQNTLEFDVEWNCPYLPRIGEIISSTVIMDKITPKMFYESFSDSAKEEWNILINDEFIDCPMEEYESWLMKDWLIDMTIKVSNIIWILKDGEYYAIITLDETSNGIEPLSPFQISLMRT